VDRNTQLIRDAAVDLAHQIAAECCPGAAPTRPPAARTTFDRARAVALIVDQMSAVVAQAVVEEREECAQIAEMMEPERPVTIATLIRDRDSGARKA
jgi:hypothetical protein